MTAALKGGEWSAARPVRTLPPGKNRYPFYRRLGGVQGRTGRAKKSRPHRDSIPGRPARSSVAIQTELPGPQLLAGYFTEFEGKIIHIRYHPYYKTHTEVSHTLKCKLFNAGFGESYKLLVR